MNDPYFACSFGFEAEAKRADRAGDSARWTVLSVREFQVELAAYAEPS